MLRVKCLVTFTDFTIIPHVVKQGQELDVTQNQYERLISSGGKFQIIGHIIPPPTTEKAGKRET